MRESPTIAKKSLKVSRLVLACHPILLLFALAFVFSPSGRTRSKTPEWVGKEKYRILVRGDPRDLNGRQSDGMPTQIAITPELLKSRLGISGKIDMASFEIERYGAHSG